MRVLLEGMSASVSVCSFAARKNKVLCMCAQIGIACCLKRRKSASEKHRFEDEGGAVSGIRAPSLPVLDLNPRALSCFNARRPRRGGLGCACPQGRKSVRAMLPRYGAPTRARAFLEEHEEMAPWSLRRRAPAGKFMNIILRNTLLWIWRRPLAERVFSLP